MTMSITETIITKKHIAGLFKGLSTNESMRFVDWESAVAWSKQINSRTNLDYKVTQVEDTNSERKRMHLFSK